MIRIHHIISNNSLTDIWSW